MCFFTFYKYTHQRNHIQQQCLAVFGQFKIKKKKVCNNEMIIDKSRQRHRLLVKHAGTKCHSNNINACSCITANRIGKKTVKQQI